MSPVDQGPGVGGPAGLLKVAQVHPFSSGHVLDPQVDRIAECPAGREIWAGLLRKGGRDGVQRVDQDEASALLGSPPGQRAEVTEVSDPPAEPGSDGVELHGPAPGALGGQVTASGTHDQPPLLTGRPDDGVVAEWAVLRKNAVDLQRAAALQQHPAGHRRRLAAARDDRAAVLGVGRRPAQRPAQSLDRLRRDAVLHSARIQVGLRDGWVGSSKIICCGLEDRSGRTATEIFGSDRHKQYACCHLEPMLSRRPTEPFGRVRSVRATERRPASGSRSSPGSRSDPGDRGRRCVAVRRARC